MQLSLLVSTPKTRGVSERPFPPTNSRIGRNHDKALTAAAALRLGAVAFIFFSAAVEEEEDEEDVEDIEDGSFPFSGLRIFAEEDDDEDGPFSSTEGEVEAVAVFLALAEEGFEEDATALTGTTAVGFSGKHSLTFFVRTSSSLER